MELALTHWPADILATVDCLRAMGAAIEIQDGICKISPILTREKEAALCCRESGSTLRFLLPLAAAVCLGASFTGQGRLLQRPLLPLIKALKDHGVNIWTEASGKEEIGAEGFPAKETGTQKTAAHSFAEQEAETKKTTAQECAAQEPNAQKTAAQEFEVEDRSGACLQVRGRPASGLYTISGNVSSQFISGLLFTLPLLPGDSRIKLTTKLESSPYVDMTLDALERFGIAAKREPGGFFIPGGQIYHGASPRLEVEGDWSGAAFFLASGAVGGSVICRGLNLDSRQGDKAILQLLSRFGAKVETGLEATAEPGSAPRAEAGFGAAAEPGSAPRAEAGFGAAAEPGLASKAEAGFGAAAEPGSASRAEAEFGAAAEPGSAPRCEAKAGEEAGKTAGGGRGWAAVSPAPLTAMDVDVSQIPDLLPILAVIACKARGASRFQKAGRLRFKESDRLKNTAALINALGGRAEEGADSLTVYGSGGLTGGTVSACGDHRMAMAAAVAAQLCREPVIITDAEAVEKSYPDFFRDYNRLGGCADVI